MKKKVIPAIIIIVLIFVFAGVFAAAVYEALFIQH